MGITIFKIFIWGGILSDIRLISSEIHLLGTVKLNFPSYIRQYISPNENFEYSYPLIYFITKIILVLIGSLSLLQYFFHREIITFFQGKYKYVSVLVNL